jgi:hypothetical protein
MFRRFTTSLLAVCFAIPAAFAAPGEENMISKESADKLLSSQKFKPVKSKNEIPKLWWHAEDLENLSDIGGAFDAGCTGQGPHRRLMLGAVNEPYSIVITEQGGIAYLTEFKVYKHEGNSVHLIYSEMIRDPRVNEIRKKLGAG